MGTGNTKETPPHPSSSEWSKKAPIYKLTETPGKDRGQRREMRNFKNPLKNLHQETFMDGVMMFAKLTTCHGPGHVIRNRGTCCGWMWAIITFVLYCCLMVIQVNLLIKFSKREIHTQTTLESAKISGLALPSIIICNRGFFSKAKMKAQGISDEVANYIILAFLNQSLINQDTINTDEGYENTRRAHNDLLRILNEKNMTIDQLITSISYSCEDIILKCSYLNAINSTQCCKQFIPIPTVTGLCFNRPQQADQQTSSGELSGFAVFTKLPVDDLMEFVPKMIDLSKLIKIGIQVTVTSNLSYPGYLVMGQGSILTPHELTSLRVSVTETDRRRAKTYLDFHLPSCVRAEDMDMRFNKAAFLSTSVSCADGTYFKCYKEISDCYSYPFTSPSEKTNLCNFSESMAYNIHLYKEFATVFKQEFLDYGFKLNKSVSAAANACVTREINTCTPVCVELSYADESEASEIRPELLKEAYKEFQLDESKEKISVVTIFFATLKYASIKEWREDLLDLLSNSGSFMGLFLGCSLITATELTIANIHFCLWAWHRFRFWLCSHLNQPKSTTHRIKVSIRPVSPH